MSVTPERRAQAQIAYREIFYAREDGKLTTEQYEQALREWHAIYPDFAPGSGCCGNVFPVSESQS